MEVFPLLLRELIREFAHHPKPAWISGDALSVDLRCGGICVNPRCASSVWEGGNKSGYLMVLLLLEAILRGHGELEELCGGAWNGASCPLGVSPPGWRTRNL